LKCESKEFFKWFQIIIFCFEVLAWKLLVLIQYIREKKKKYRTVAWIILSFELSGNFKEKALFGIEMSPKVENSKI